MPTNRLAQEKSPYLLQHAHNPVAWYPWGEEAFAKARQEDKPIFLSVGYSTCHWCHVMEKESFEDLEIARLLEQDFIAIKVDREERPDVDRLYMLFVQATTGRGGWPLSVFLTPTLQPFFGGTYFPAKDQFGRPGFATVVSHIAETWKKERAKLLESATQIVEELGRRTSSTGAARAALSEVAFNEALQKTFSYFVENFDEVHGGFGKAPKFPRPSVLQLLFRYHARTGERAAREMAVKTLAKMRLGGMNDQVGGGFHRYSVDERWFVPHFEKMLYDQAQLAVAYLEAFQITEKQEFAAEARAILAYVLRDLRHPEGGFFSAEDADSAPDASQPARKAEGAYYLWTEAELEAALGLPESAWLAYHYGVLDDGNVDPEEDPHHQFTGKNILFVDKSFEETAALFEVHPQEIRGGVAESKPKLLAARNRLRPRPQRDEKILTAWNGLMISALARASMVLEDSEYLEAAERAAGFVWSNLWNAQEQQLYRRHCDGESAVHAFLDDYALLATALVDLYEATFALLYLQRALLLADRMVALFADPQEGGFFATTADASDVLLRLKEAVDGAEPSGTGAATLLLARLAAIAGREDYGQLVDATLAWAGPRFPVEMPQMPLLAAAQMLRMGPARQVVLAGEPGTATDCSELAGIARRRYAPNQVLLAAHPDHPSAVVRQMVALDNRPTAYVCQHFTCELPVHSVYDLVQALGKK